MEKMKATPGLGSLDVMMLAVKQNNDKDEQEIRWDEFTYKTT